MRTPLLLAALLLPATALAEVQVTPVEAPSEGLESFQGSRSWPVVLRGGPTLTRLGRARVRWGSPARELVFSSSPQGRRREVLAPLVDGGPEASVASIASQAGGEPRVYLSDRDDLVALTVDYGTWDTCPELRALRPEGAQAIPLPCPEAGRAALEALQEAGHVPAGNDARTRMRFRLSNIRYVQPGFLAAGGVELDAELRLTTWSKEPRLHRARFVLRDGRIQSCTLLD